MPTIFWDASALLKRYISESGSDTVNSLFSNVLSTGMVVTITAYAETFAALVRTRNRGNLSDEALEAAASALELETIYSPDFGVLPVDFGAVVDSIPLIRRHNINAADAAALVTYGRYSQLVAEDAPCLLVASDRRFLRAAEQEGLRILNPETVSPSEVSAMLAAGG